MPSAAIRVLLVEDSSSDAELLQLTLERTGAGRFEFTWVERLAEALSRLGQESFDVLLLDLSLPDSSGPDTFRRAHNAAPHLPIVVLTGASDESLGLAAVQEGVQDYLVKGQTDGRQIARAIRYAIERQQAEERLRQQREWFRVTLASIGDAVIAGDTEGRIDFLNPAAESLTGWKTEEALGQPIQRVFHIINARTRRPADDLVSQVLHERRVVSLPNDTTLLTKDGREVAIEDSAAPILDSAGHVTGVVLVFQDVTQKRRAQAALAAAHAEAVNEKNRLHAVMESLPVGVALLDALGGSVRSNPAFEAVWGAPPTSANPVSGHAVYKAWWTATGQSVQPDEWASARAVQKGETVVGQEMQIQRFDGARAFVLNNAAPIRDAQGRIAGSAVAIMDITELKRAEEALRESEERQRVAEAVQVERQRFNDILEKLPAMVCLLTPDYRVSFANRRFRELFGESEGRPCFECMFHRTEPCPECQSFTTLKTNLPHHWEWAAPNGAYFDIYAFPFTDPDGSPRVLEVDFDITERKRAEAELAKHRDHLEELVQERTRQVEAADLQLRAETVERRFLADLLERADQPFGVGYADGTLGFVNSAFERLTGYTRDELKGSSWAAVLTPPEWRETERSKLDELQRTGQPVRYEKEYLRKDGARVPVELLVHVVKDEQGTLLHYYAFLNDLTERKRIEAERAQQARLKDEFLALLSHELRNPLAAISTASQLLSNGVAAERRASLNVMIGRQVAVLQRLVDDLLDIARISHGQVELKKEPIDLSEFMQRVTGASRSPIAGRGQELVVRLPSEHVRFMADPVRLEQIAANLLNNASKYTGRGGRIELAGARAGSEVVIRCKDDGRGIPPGMRERIFEPFTRLQMAGQSAEAGVGIGLALVKRLAELHGGTVTVDSGGPGMGSEFVVRLPLVKPPPVPRPVRKAAPARRPGRQLSVVVVEDNPDVAETLATGLEQAGHRVRLFADGPSALSGLARLKPHAVLLDIGLPGMDGYELASRLRQKRNLRHTLFVGLSGFKQRVQAGEGRGDFDHYFVKPVDLAKLLTLLETHASGKNR